MKLYWERQQTDLKNQIIGIVIIVLDMLAAFFLFFFFEKYVML